MNELFLNLGMERLKPLVTAFLLPPVPFLLLALMALGLVGRRRRLGNTLLLLGLALTWLSSCVGTASALAPLLLRLSPALTEQRIAELRRHAAEPVAIMVLGGGVEDWAPEYDSSNLPFHSLERLRYGIWLGRQTGWPTGFSGGVGWGQMTGKSPAAEAKVAQRIATQEFDRPLRWVESNSRDTRENALNTVALLSAQGIRHVLLVTNAWHMSRALRNFERARGSRPMSFEAAPMGLASETELPVTRWLPSGEGLSQTRSIVREWLGLVGGA